MVASVFFPLPFIKQKFYEDHLGSQRCSIKKVFLKNCKSHGKKRLHWILLLNVAGLRSATLFKKTPTQVLSSEYCEIFKSSFFKEHLQWVLLHICYYLVFLFKLQSNLFKTTTLGTSQKRSSWTGGRLTKHLYKTTTNKFWSFLAGFSFLFPLSMFYKKLRFAGIKRFTILRVLVSFLKIKNVLSYY